MMVRGKVGCLLLLMQNAVPNWLKPPLELLTEASHSGTK